ncbi:MAG: SDR family NAD(P)-dependent oxidoreductase [Sphingomonadales bacterium]
MKDVQGKTAFITGGASGMGLGMAKAFTNAGMKVVIADIRREALDEALKENFSETNFDVHGIQLDVTNRDQWVQAADEAEERYGNIHLLSLNAGVGVIAQMQTATYKDWDFCMGVNVDGCINGLVTMLPRMLKHGEPGHVVATSSTGGFSAVSGAGLYCTAKFAVAGMMESLASDLKGTTLGASVFFPGPVQTNLGISTNETRPAHLRNEATPDGGPEFRRGPRPAFDPSVFMTKEEVGERVLRGIQNGDLFIMSHPEFRAGIVARNEALLRAIPQEEPNTVRHEVLKNFGTLLYNPIYDEQKQVVTPR